MVVWCSICYHGEEGAELEDNALDLAVDLHSNPQELWLVTETIAMFTWSQIFQTDQK